MLLGKVMDFAMRLGGCVIFCEKSMGASGLEESFRIKHRKEDPQA